MSQQSRLVQLNDWVVVEYLYATDNLRTFDLGAIVQNNAYFNYKQFCNADYATSVTGNVLDQSASRLALTQWVLTDIDVPTQYIDVDTKLGKTDITTTLDGLTQVYDTVRFHILSGYNLEGIQGFIAEIIATDNMGGTCLFASQCYLISDTTLQFSTLPLFLGDRMYDRYLDVKIPSLQDMNLTYNSQPSNTTTLGYQLSTGNAGFNNDSLLALNFYEVTTRTVSKTFTYLTTGQRWQASFPQADTYFLFACQIAESTEGDYFEYYPTYDGGFIESYIGDLNSVGGSWIVINDLVVYEQIGTAEIITASSSSQQTTGFNQSMLFRPIILNAEAYAFSIQYTCRLLNRNDGSQIIRVSTVTSKAPKKYGRNLQKLTLLNPSEPQKIYNKVVQSTPLQLNPVQQIYKTTAVYYPAFFELFNIALSNPTVFIDNSGNLAASTNLDSTIVWGPGEAVIYLTPFVNYVKFKILELDTDGVYDPLDLNYNSNIYLTFVTDSTTTSASSSQIQFANVVDSTLANIAAGEILFKIPEESAQQLLNFNTKTFYLNVITPSGDTMALYQGSFDNYSNIGNMVASVDDARSAALNAQITLLQSLQATNTTSNTVVVSPNTTSTAASSSSLVVNPTPITIDTTNASNANATATATGSASSLLDIIPAALIASNASANTSAASIQAANIASTIITAVTPASTTVQTTVNPTSILDVASTDIVTSALSGTTTTTTIAPLIGDSTAL